MSKPTIEVTGRARRDVGAESYQLEFEIEAEAERANDARARASDRQRTVIDAIEAVSDVTSADFRTGFMRETATMFDDDADAAFTARRSAEVRSPTDVAEDVVTAGIQSGALLEGVERDACGGLW